MDERPVSLESATADAVECFKGLCERVVMMREALDRSVPRDAMERRCARLQRQIDESHAALRRRNARMAEISAERAERTCRVDFDEEVGCWRCSECGWELTPGDEQFCPMCGAKVIGETE